MTQKFSNTMIEKLQGVTKLQTKTFCTNSLPVGVEVRIKF